LPLVAAVFAAATFVTFGVTSVSTHSVLDGLEQDPSRQLPLLVEVTHERLDLWYDQRKSDLAAFSGSAALVEQVERLGGPDGGSARREIAAYLEQLRADYPIFESFFLLDPVGEVVLLSGPGPLPSLDERRSLVISSVSEPGVRFRGKQADHLVSAPLRRGAFGLSLHALIPAEALRSALEPIRMEAGGAVHVVDANQRQIVSVGQGVSVLPPLSPLETPGGEPETERMAGDDGPLLIVASANYGRHGWRLVASRMVEWDPAVTPAPNHLVMGVKGALVLFFTLVAVVFSSVLLRPIRAFQEATRALAERDLGAPAMTGRDAASREVGILTRTFVDVREHLRRYQDELARKRREIAAANDRLRSQNEQLRHANQVLEKLSVTDELTGLHNQRYFREHLPREMTRASRTGEPLTLILFDIDNFKQLNDCYGHAAGDAVLQHIAGVIAEQTRDMDLLARYGGEEFALLASQTPLDGAVALAEKIRIAVRQTRIALEEDAEPVRITISAGAASYRGEECDLFEDADAALYRAKAFGKDQVVAA
jgi:diguanylate cyclase (GGDEF)-like protein